MEADNNGLLDSPSKKKNNMQSALFTEGYDTHK